MKWQYNRFLICHEILGVQCRDSWPEAEQAAVAMWSNTVHGRYTKQSSESLTSAFTQRCNQFVLQTEENYEKKDAINLLFFEGKYLEVWNTDKTTT